MTNTRTHKSFEKQAHAMDAVQANIFASVMMTVLQTTRTWRECSAANWNSTADNEGV